MPTRNAANEIVTEATQTHFQPPSGRIGVCSTVGAANVVASAAPIAASTTRPDA
jgi:hypothetical protein